MRIPFGVTSAVSESLPLSSQRLSNCYLQQAPLGAKTPVAVPRSAGIRTLAALSDGGTFRGYGIMRKALYVVLNTTLYRIAANGSGTVLGSIPGAGRVSVTTNGSQLTISNGMDAYVWDGTTLAQITDPDFPGSTWLAYLDGYTIFGFPGGDQFGITAINDSTDVDALDFASAESAPDDLVAGIVDHRELFLFGEDSFEVWFNSGDADFPFERTGSGVGEVGIAGQFAVGKKANSVYFLGNDAIAYKLDGYNPVRISTFEIERHFQARAKAGTIAECVVETWTERGHAFIAFKFSDGTFIFDEATQLWHERGSYGLTRWQADFIAPVYGTLFTGANGVIGELSAEVYAEFDQPHIASCTAPAVSDGNAWIELDRLELIFEMGVGLNTGQGSHPQVMLDWSNDGGRNWESERWASLGDIGDHKARAVFTRMGRSRDWVPRWSVSDPVKLWFMEARLNEEGG